MKKETKNIKNKLEESIMLIVLACIKDLKTKVGTNKLIAILIGSESNYIYENKFNKNAFYGFLQHYNSKQIKKIIDRLSSMNLIEAVEVEDGYYSNVFDLTKKGLKCIKSMSIKNPNFFDKIIKVKKTDLDSKSKDLFNRLRVVRKDIAKSISKPAFIVCSDKVLRDVASKKPSNTTSLLKIKGIGKHFINEYSDLFLNEIEINAA